ncbi:MAG: tetratricopeptide repeat protein [Candidatus Omnitrophica bacterium]|nr:tetratricopeptide repeat protein [Candidatus Omnitrophota bacterium]
MNVRSLFPIAASVLCFALTVDSAEEAVQQSRSIDREIQQIERLVQQNNYIDCVTECIQLLERDDALADVHYYLAKSLRIVRGNPQKCLMHARKAVELEPSFPHQKELLNVLYFLKRYEEAQRLAESLLRKRDDPDIHYNLAVIAMRLGDRDAMRTRLELMLKTHPDFVSALILRASDFIDQHQYETAAPWIERALSLDPDHVQANYLQGRVAFQSQDYQQAAKAFERVVDLDPLHHHALFQLSRAYTFLGDADSAMLVRRSLEAVKALSEEQKDRFRIYQLHHPENTESYWNLCSFYLEIQRGDLASQALEKLLELNPHHGDALLTMAGILMASHQDEKALPYLDRAVTIPSKQAAARIARAMAYYRLERCDCAEADCTAILKGDPAHIKARQLLDAIQRKKETK